MLTTDSMLNKIFLNLCLSLSLSVSVGLHVCTLNAERFLYMSTYFVFDTIERLWIRILPDSKRLTLHYKYRAINAVWGS